MHHPIIARGPCNGQCSAKHVARIQHKQSHAGTLKQEEIDHSLAALNYVPLLLCPHQDVYDKSRQPLIKSLKTDGSTWVSKYARGGSARSQSARNMYIAVDAVQGYLASNG